jgi:hypothetical protein
MPVVTIPPIPLTVVFIHIPKTGGTSVEQYFGGKLGKTLDKNNYSTEHIQPIPNSLDPNVSPQHQLFSGMVKVVDKFDICFSIVRNPYTRLISDLFFIGLINEKSSQQDVEVAILKYLTESIKLYDYHHREQYKFLQNDQGEIDSRIKILKKEDLVNGMISIGFNDFNVYENQNRGNVAEDKYMSFLSDWSIKLINIFYKRDFELFDYNMI